MNRCANRTPSDAGSNALATCLSAFEAEFDHVHRLLVRFGVHEADAEDLAQEVFVVMWRRWADYDQARPLRPWLSGIAFRVALKHRERPGREVPGGLLDLRDESPSPEDRVAAERVRALVLHVLDGLPEKHQNILLLHDVEGLSMREIADALAVPLATAHTRHRSARLAFSRSVRRLATVNRARAELVAAARLAALAPTPTDPRPIDPEARRRARARARTFALAMPFGPRRRPVADGIARWSAGIGAAAAVTVGLVGVPALLRPPSEHGGRAQSGVARAHAPGVAGPSSLVSVLTGAPPLGRGPLPEPRPADPLVVEALGRELIGYWRFDEGSGTVAHDLSSSGNDCTFSRKLDPRTSWIAGPLGGAISLQNHGWLECPRTEALRNITDQLTVALWVARTGLTKHVKTLVSWSTVAPAGLDHFMMGFRYDTVALRRRPDEGPLYAPLARPMGTWFHVAATIGGGVARVYVDGALVREETGVGRPSLGAGSDPLAIGATLNRLNTKRAHEVLMGGLDELVLYARALSAEEILALASGAQPRPADHDRLSQASSSGPVTPF